MAYEYNPNDFKPGMEVTPEMAEVYFRHNVQTIVIALMLRLGKTDITINAEDCMRLAAIPPGSGLLAQCNAEGLRIALLGPGASAALRRGGA